MKINSVRISNFSLIKDIEIDFDKKLNVVSGQSGSGKSLIFKAMRIAFGQQASPTLIREGYKKAVIEIELELTPEEIIVFNSIVLIDIQNKFILSKVITQNKSTTRIDGEIVSSRHARDLYNCFVNSFSQGDQNLLYNKIYQRDLTDKFGNLDSHVDDVSVCYVVWKSFEKELNNLINIQEQLKQEYEFNIFVKNEIEDININIEEDSSIEDRIKYLSNQEKYIELFNKKVSHCKDILSIIGDLQRLESDEGYYTEKLLDIEDYIEDMQSNFQMDLDHIEDSEGLDELQNRSYILNGLMRKYRCGSLEELIEYKNKIEEKIENVDNYDYKIKELTDKAKDSYEIYLTKARELSFERKQAALTLLDVISEELLKLNFATVYAELSYSEIKSSFKGIDELEFLISFNKGMPVQPLHRIVSGGEASRLALAVLSNVSLDNKVLFLDELDSGLDPVSLEKVASCLKKISANNQIICISHNKEIQNCSDRLISIEKYIDEDDKTNIRSY